jgi:hypothetical protein
LVWCRVQTSYVAVEPKRRRQDPRRSSNRSDTGDLAASLSTTAASAEVLGTGESQDRSQSGRELRRARIVITVKRTESYRQWLLDNPLQSVLAGDEDDDENEVVDDDEVEVAAAQQQER